MFRRKTFAVACVMFFILSSIVTAQQDTVINIVEWTTVSGGNGHNYGIIPLEMPWNEHKALAETQTYLTDVGYLATITSAEENQFIIDNILSAMPNPPTVNSQFYLGGQEFNNGNWIWHTGEPFAYTNWSPGEPNNIGIDAVIGIWGASHPNAGFWNDSPPDTINHSSINQLYAIIEFGDLPTGNGSLTLDDVIGGSLASNEIYVDSLVSFKIRVNNNTGETVDGIINGFKISSPDGATWTQTTADTIGTLGGTLFDLLSEINFFSIDGAGADSIQFAGVVINSTGLVDGFNEVSYEINIGPIPLADTGKTICIDSTWTPPTGEWIWSKASGTDPPSWDGPHCFTIIAPPPPIDTLINLVQWTTAMGGNDHWYGIISLVQNWDSHIATVATLDVGGDTGYLLTVTSAEENQFILDNVLTGNTGQPSVADEFYIGGLFTTTWTWINNEPFVYTNWAVGEPSGDGLALAMWGASHPEAGKWNDVPRNIANDTFNRLWAVVEFGVDAPSGTLLDSLIIPTNDNGYGEHDQFVAAWVSQPMKGATIALKIPAGINIIDVTTTGYLTDSWDFNIIQVKPDSGFIFVVLANSQGETIPPGQKVGLFVIRFEGNNPNCDVPLIARWDTTLSDDVSRRFAFADINSQTVLGAFDINRDSVVIPELVPGDFTDDGNVDITDLVELVSYMFLGGSPPANINSTDVNGDCAGPDIGDLVKLIDFMFQSGADLQCGCLTNIPKISSTQHEDISIDIKYIDSKSYISVSSSIDLLGIELLIRNKNDIQAEKIYTENLDLLHNYDNGITKVGIVDLQGNNAILSGKTMLLSFEGEIELASAVVADKEARSIIPSINSKISLLPEEYKLFQNYPNPFNPTTQISFWLPEAGAVSLVIYNINGQKVTTLVDEYKEAGQYTVEWNGTTQSSGIYLYRFESNNFSTTKKMLYLK